MLVELVVPALAVPVPPVTPVALKVVPGAFPVLEVVTAVVSGAVVGAAPADVESIPLGKVIVPMPLQRTLEKDDSCITSSSVSCAGQKVE